MSQNTSLHGDITDKFNLLLSADCNLDTTGCQLILEENLSSIDIFNTHETNILR